MVHIGLTSRDAQQRLHLELQHYMQNTVKVNWLQEIKRMPYIPTSSLLIALSGLLLVVDFGAQSGERDRRTIFQAVLLLLLAFLNFFLFFWEIRILKTRRIKNLLSRINPFLNQPCPWTPRSYPRSLISTLRGHFTVHTYRDNTLVNLPTSLLVQDDVIELHKGLPSPARVALLEADTPQEMEKNSTSDFILDIGEIPQDEWFGSASEPLDVEKIAFCNNLKVLKFRVLSTPIISLLESSVANNKPKTFITKEKNYALIAAEVFVVITYVVTLVWNIIRYFSLPDDFDDSTQEMLLALPVYTTMPLLLATLPLVWTTMNLYGTARITLFVEKGPEFANVQGMGRLQNVYLTLIRMFNLVFRCSKYPNYRAFHILGSLTSVCAIDKEYLLTGGFPMAEKVFFLRTEDIAGGERSSRVTDRSPGERREEEEGEEEEDDDQSDVDERSEEDEMNSSQTSNDVDEPHLTIQITKEAGDGQHSTGPSVKFAVTSHQHDDSPASTPIRLPKVRLTPEPQDTSSVHSEHEERSPASKKKLAPPHSTQGGLQPSSEVGSTTSSLSDAAPFEVVTEILDLSPDPENDSGVCFDDINWQVYIGSLKPIGVNLLATSHLLKDMYSWCPMGSTEELRQYLYKTSCACPFGVEVGVTEFSTSQFEKQVLLYSFGDPPSNFQKSLLRRANSTFLCNSMGVVQPHIISSVLQDYKSTSYLLMSRGSGEMVASCCSDFWDGRDLQPMTDMERNTILDFFNRRSLTSYCIALSYCPLLGVNVAPLKSRKIGIYIPTGQMNKTGSSILSSTEKGAIQPKSAEDVFGCLQCNQVFLGLLAFQFKPKHDIVFLIEDLRVAGIRFVHFTAENEVRGKIFAQKLGLEADWNCHISLAPAEEEEEDTSSESSSALGSSRSTSASSLSSFINANMSYSRARLPKGIDNVRPHIQDVDNVPLLVPLFTDCTAQTIREMIQIMQENSEVVLCIGNAWNRDNLNIFAQADVSLSLIPEYVDSSNCNVTETCALSTSNSSQNASILCDERTWPSPLEMASYLNATTCQLCFHRDNDVSLLSLITESRHVLSQMRHGLLFGLGASLSLVILFLLATVLFLPPPLDSSHLFWNLLFIIPIVTLSFLASPTDASVKSQMPNRKKYAVWSDKLFYVVNFVLTFAPSAVVCLLVFAFTIGHICSNEIEDSDCHALLGNRNISSVSAWNGWRGEDEQGLLLAQDIVALFWSVYLIILSIRFVHRTTPLWKLWRHISWQYIVIMAAVLVLQLVYFAVSQSIAVQVYDLPQIASLSSVPIQTWVVGIAWPFVLIPVQELLKYHDKLEFVRVQTHLKLEFETKLGMHSPV